MMKPSRLKVTAVSTRKPAIHSGWSMRTGTMKEAVARITRPRISATTTCRTLPQSDCAGVTAREIGRVGGDHVTVSVNGQVAVHTPVVEAENAWATAIEKKMHRG